jgi:peptidoglycan/xylan/chitin deacetylase (PgdA/CDA1 family)
VSYRVLAYHSVGAYPALLPAGIATPPADFAAQLDWLVRSGFSAVPLERVASGAAGPRDVAITFDDGYADNLENAVPALAARGMPATFFIPAALMGRSVRQGPVELAVMTPGEVARLAATPGMEVGSHGDNHVSLSRLPPDALRAELEGSKRRLEEVTGRPVRFLAYPYGDFDEAAREAARRAGYQEAFTVWTRGEGPFARLRIPVHTRDRVLLFSLKMSPLYFPIKRLWKR